MERTQGGRPPTSQARGSYAVGDERRARILDVAVEHFAQWGFHASSLARIAKDVGITQGGLLHHFRSKEDLFVSVLQRSDERVAERFFSPESQSVTDAFTTLIDVIEYNAARPGHTRMFNVLAAEASDLGHPAHDYFVRHYRASIEGTAESLQAAVEHGELKPDTDCEGVASEVVAVMDGLQLQWALAPQTYDMAGRLHAYLDRLLRALSVDGAGMPVRT